ncbi:MAG: DUF1207 domain-containing protein [Gemmatimonadales bacterium]
MPILDNGATRRATALAILALAAGAPPAAGQRLLFPDVAPFETPIGDPRPAGIYGRLLNVRRGESLYGAEREAEAAAGESFPVFALSRSANPVVIGMSLGVAARFSLDDPRSALISTDWTVGIRGRATPGPWVVDLHLYHESSHLGDEYADRFEASRIDWTREVGSLTLGRRLGAFTAHGRLSYTLIDELSLEPWAAAVAPISAPLGAPGSSAPRSDRWPGLRGRRGLRELEADHGGAGRPSWRGPAGARSR